MDRGVVEWPGHLTGDQKGFHTSCGQLFWLISEFIPTPPQRQKYGYKKPIVLHNTSGRKNVKEKYVNYSSSQQNNNKWILWNAFIITLITICVVNNNEINTPASPPAIPPGLWYWLGGEAVSHQHVWTHQPLIIRVLTKSLTSNSLGWLIHHRSGHHCLNMHLNAV